MSIKKQMETLTFDINYSYIYLKSFFFFLL